MNILVFTSLDDALLDHDSYSYDAAKAGLEHIRRQQIPMIFTTSKTRVEIERLQADMQILEPFIAESGAAVFFPDDYRNFKIDAGFHTPPYTVIHLGATCSEIRRFVYSVKERFGIKGFGNLRPDEIEFLTGLSPEHALLARQREFTEPFLIEDKTKIDEMALLAASRGFKITSGERFFNLAGIRQDKGCAVRLCAQIFARNTDGSLMTIGLGDSADDISMLKCVDIPILLPRIDGSFEHIDLNNLIRANHPSSRGWSDTLLSVLNSMEKS
ncbi:MAG: HAD hydrolase family protein [Pseudomonadota bacterium]